MYGVLYTKGKGERWFCDELGNFVLSVMCRKGVRQSCVLGRTIMCITDRPAYDVILAIMGPEGFLLSYADDVYLGGVPGNVALALAAVLSMYRMIGLLLGWGLRKTKLEFPHGCDPDNLPLPRDPPLGNPCPK